MAADNAAREAREERADRERATVKVRNDSVTHTDLASYPRIGRYWPFLTVIDHYSRGAPGSRLLPTY